MNDPVVRSNRILAPVSGARESVARNSIFGSPDSAPRSAAPAGMQRRSIAVASGDVRTVKQALKTVPPTTAGRTAAWPTPAVKPDTAKDYFAGTGWVGSKTAGGVASGQLLKSAVQINRIVLTQNLAGSAYVGQGLGAVGVVVKATALYVTAKSLAETSRIEKSKAQDFAGFAALVEMFDADTRDFALPPVAAGESRDMSGLPFAQEMSDTDPPVRTDADIKAFYATKLTLLSKEKGFVEALATGNGLTPERVILLKKAVITAAEGTTSLAVASAASWAGFVALGADTAKFVDGGLKVANGITGLNNLRGAVANLQKSVAENATRSPEAAASAEKTQKVLLGLAQQVSRERLIKGSKDLVVAAAYGATASAGLAVALKTGGMGAMIANPALALVTAGVEIAVANRDKRHAAMLGGARSLSKSAAVANDYAAGRLDDLGKTVNIGVAERMALHLLTAGTPDEKAAVTKFLTDLGIPKQRLVAIRLHASMDSEDGKAIDQLTKALYKDRLSSTQKMSWSLVGHSFTSFGKMFLHVFKGWRNAPKAAVDGRQISVALSAEFKKSIVSRRSEGIEPSMPEPSAERPRPLSNGSDVSSFRSRADEEDRRDDDAAFERDDVPFVPRRSIGRSMVQTALSRAGSPESDAEAPQRGAAPGAADILGSDRAASAP